MSLRPSVSTVLVLVLAGAGLAAALPAMAQTPPQPVMSGVQPWARDALVRAQVTFSEQNRREETTFTTLAVLNNVLLLPLGIGAVLVLLGMIKAAKARVGAASRPVLGWLLLGAVVWINLTMVSQAALNGSDVARFRYGAFMARQIRHQLDVPEKDVLITKVEYADSYLNHPVKWMFMLSWAVPTIAGLFTVVWALGGLRQFVREGEDTESLSRPCTTATVLTIVVFAILLCQSLVAMFVQVSGA